MSPVALLYILLASPIFSENLYSRRHFNELPISHYSKNFNVERLFRESPLDSILSTSTPSWLRRSNVFGSRRSLISEIFPEEESLFGESTYEPFSMRHVSLRNVEVIRRLAVEHPEMLNVVIEKLIKNFRPESRLWEEPSSLIFGEKLIRKLPVYLREKIIRRLAKKSVLPSWISTVSTRRSLYEPTFESPIMTKVAEKIIRCNVEKKIVKKIVKKVLRVIKKTVRSPYHVEEMLFRTESPLSMHKSTSTKRIVKRIVKKIVKRLVKKALRHNKRFGGYTPMPWSNKNFCMNFCSNTCMYNWTPMCNMCTMCNTWSPMSPSSFTPFTPSFYNTKNVEKLIKKLSAEELLF